MWASYWAQCMPGGNIWGQLPTPAAVGFWSQADVGSQPQPPAVGYWPQAAPGPLCAPGVWAQAMPVADVGSQWMHQTPSVPGVDAGSQLQALTAGYWAQRVPRADAGSQVPLSAAGCWPQPVPASQGPQTVLSWPQPQQHEASISSHRPKPPVAGPGSTGDGPHMRPTATASFRNESARPATGAEGTQHLHTQSRKRRLHQRLKPHMLRRRQQRTIAIPRRLWTNRLPRGCPAPRLPHIVVEDPVESVTYMLCSFCQSDKIWTLPENLIKHVESGNCPNGFAELERLCCGGAHVQQEMLVGGTGGQVLESQSQIWPPAETQNVPDASHARRLAHGQDQTFPCPPDRRLRDSACLIQKQVSSASCCATVMGSQATTVAMSAPPPALVHPAMSAELRVRAPDAALDRRPCSEAAPDEPPAARAPDRALEQPPQQQQQVQEQTSAQPLPSHLSQLEPPQQPQKAQHRHPHSAFVESVLPVEEASSSVTASSGDTQDKEKLLPYAIKLRLLRELRHLCPRKYRELSNSIMGLQNRTAKELTQLVEDARQKPECNSGASILPEAIFDSTAVQHSFGASLTTNSRDSSTKASAGKVCSTDGPERTVRPSQLTSSSNNTLAGWLAETERTAPFTLAACRSEFLQRDLRWAASEDAAAAARLPLASAALVGGHGWSNSKGGVSAATARHLAPRATASARSIVAGVRSKVVSQKRVAADSDDDCGSDGEPACDDDWEPGQRLRQRKSRKTRLVEGQR
eukprot:gnl/TRDRNA2_/TRDRNA2_168236_c0_seq3.p1 gnl/TRDRNA2_/TRDRNA2_168236_c0~~gnl/TRDRNA2_/TRDRNA2_168236_c0_seq3.p1  ORF type:complete len:748 (-),score=106.10 gnl/TRDRNA2_/TRDRNA2_168236_c0_seq3:58-2301(-)